MELTEKIMSAEMLADRLEALRRTGKKIVFTNGCFDILHLGHVRYLAASRKCGDALVVGLNSDASVQNIKGPLRPINCQTHRAEVLAGLQCVDFVVIFDQPDPEALIRLLCPDVLVKGADWAESDIIGGDFVKSRGGQVVRIPVVGAVSTTDVIERIVRRYGRM